MRVLVVIQARTGSTRLPGKVLAPLAGRPALELMIARVRRTRWPVLVATSDLPQDDPVARLALGAGCSVFRGSEQDVLGRFAAALAAHPADIVVRLTADCPLIDPDLVVETVARLEQERADYVGNSIIRSFPDGLDVEALRTEVLLTADREAVRADEREHVTPFVYRHPERFFVRAILHDQPLDWIRWTVDLPADLEFLDALVTRSPDPVGASWREFLRLPGAVRGRKPNGARLRAALPGDLSTHGMDLFDVGARVLVLSSGEGVLGHGVLCVRAADASWEWGGPERWQELAQRLLPAFLHGDPQVLSLHGTSL